MSSELIAGLSTVITALMSALAGAVVLVLNAKSQNRARDSVQKQNEYEKIIARYEKDIARREAHGDNQQVIITRLQEANAQLRERLADVKGRYEIIYNYARRQFEAMRKQGVTAEPPPEDLPPEDHDVVAQAEHLDFNVRQVENASNILRRTRPQPPGPLPSSEIKESTADADKGPSEPGAVL